jgi:RNA polymerase sigma-70 factor (ECF subfamily)
MVNYKQLDVGPAEDDGLGSAETPETLIIMNNTNSFAPRHFVEVDSMEHLRTNDLVRSMQADGIESKAGSDAFSDLYRLYYMDALRAATSIVKNDALAEELVQTAFIKVLRCIEEKYVLDPEVPVKAWLMQVVINSAKDYYRTKNNSHSVPVAEVQDVLNDNNANQSYLADAKPYSDDTREAFEKLPENQRIVMVMRFILGYSLDEIAEYLGKSKNSVNKLQCRGRAAVKGFLIASEKAPNVRKPIEALDNPALYAEFPSAA